MKKKIKVVALSLIFVGFLITIFPVSTLDGEYPPVVHKV